MSSNVKTTKKTESNTLVPSRRAVVSEIQHSDSTPYSEGLSEEISQSQSFLSNHAQRLTNLIHSEVEVLEKRYLEEDPDERTIKLSGEQLQSVTTLGHQLLETIKLGVQVAGVKMQIERGIKNERAN